MVPKQMLLLLLMWSLSILLMMHITKSPPADYYYPLEVANLIIMAQQNCISDQNENQEDIVPLEYKLDPTTDLPENTEKLKQFIYFVNTLQPIFNHDMNIEPIIDIDLVILVQVHDRLTYLKELIKSLSTAPQINRTLLIFSHDVYDQDVNQAIQSIQFTKVMQIFYPFSIQTHRKSFPGPDFHDCQSAEKLHPDCLNINFKDSYGNFRNATLAQVKHHWWWKITFLFNKIRVLRDYFGLVLLLEEDHYLTPDFVHSLKMMETFSQRQCPECWFFALGVPPNTNYYFNPVYSNHVVIRHTVENLGLAFNRSIWYKLLRHAEDFCEYDDYNWDWSLRYIVDKLIKVKPSSMAMAKEKILHIGACGLHTGEATCDPSEAIEEFDNMQTNLFPESLTAVREDFTYKTLRNGGWKDPRDHALCMGMA